MTPLPATTDALLRRGVRMPAPHTVDVAADVKPDRIAPGVIIHAGCRIRGAGTVIGPDCVIGAEAPATVEDCQLGAGVALAGGFFSDATFLDGVSFGSCAHVRPGTLLEEQASCAHSVGLKQTLLMPFVVTGSLVNFCDCLMAGGTSRQNHSEVGSSYVHFNFTPHGDKATASLIGDVPHGVLLDQAPIFLGGQGGLVGPARIAYGTVIAAGTVWRKDVTEPGQLVMAGASAAIRSMSYDPTKLHCLNRAVTNNLLYIGNLHALVLWYRHVRAPFFGNDSGRRLLFEGALRQLDIMLVERVKRLDELVAKLRDASKSRPPAEMPDFNRKLLKNWSAIADTLRGKLGREQASALLDEFLTKNTSVGGTDYIASIQKMSSQTKTAATAWLQAEVDAITASCPIAS